MTIAGTTAARSAPAALSSKTTRPRLARAAAAVEAEAVGALVPALEEAEAHPSFGLPASDLLARLSEEGTGWQMDARVFHHAFLGVVVLLLLLLKISFIRLYRNYRRHSRLLGFLIFMGTLTTWIIAGWFWLAMFGTPTVDG